MRCTYVNHSTTAPRCIAESGHPHSPCSKHFGDQVISKDLWLTGSQRPTPSIFVFPVQPTEGKVLHEQKYVHLRFRGELFPRFPGGWSHSCGHVTTCTRRFGARRPLVHGNRRRPLSVPCMTRQFHKD